MELAQMVNPRGVWVLYSYDVRAEISMIFEQELDAFRAAQSRGMMEKVTFLPYGEEFVGA